MTDPGLQSLAKEILLSTENMCNGEAAAEAAGDSIKVHFRRLDTLLLNPKSLRTLCQKMAYLVEHLDINKAVFLDSRGYLFTEVADILNLGIVKACKKKKLADMTEISYGTEYSKSKIHMLNDVMYPGDRVLIVDDLIATGGSIGGAMKLIASYGAIPVAGLAAVRLQDFATSQRELGIDLFSVFSCLGDGPLESDSPLLSFYPTVEYASQHPDDTRTVVMSHPSCRSLAIDVIDQNPDKYRWGYTCWGHFGDTYPNITFDTNLKDRDVIYVMSMHDPAVFMEQLSVILVIPRQQVKSLRIMMSYFAPGTMDRVDSEGIIATAETIATIISSCIPSTQTGPPILEIYDIHALQERFYFKDNVIVELKSAIPILMKSYDRTWVIVFPDDGAAKRFGPKFPNYAKIVCAKKRDGERRTVEIKERIGAVLTEDDISGYIIVDDLVQTGGTLMQCAKVISAECKGRPVHAFVTHAIFPGRAYRRFMKPDSPIKRFVCTNSNPAVSDVLERIPIFKVLSLVSGDTEERREGASPIYVASTNLSKLAAVSDSTMNPATRGYLSGHTRVVGIGVPSGVSDQPIDEETYTGVQNRLKALIRQVRWEHRKCFVSLENGVFINPLGPRGPHGSRYHDKCVILVSHMGSVYTYISESVDVPPYAEPRNSWGAPRQTCGYTIERTEGLLPGTWHEIYGKKSRKLLMEECIKWGRPNACP